MRDVRLESERGGVNPEDNTTLLHVCRKAGFLRSRALHRTEGNIMKTTSSVIRTRVLPGLALALCVCLCLIVIASGIAEA
jgi:hypothetical protein